MANEMSRRPMELIESKKHHNHPHIQSQDMLPCGLDDILVTLLLLIISFVILSTPIARRASVLGLGNHFSGLRNICSRFRRNSLLYNGNNQRLDDLIRSGRLDKNFNADKTVRASGSKQSMRTSTSTPLKHLFPGSKLYASCSDGNLFRDRYAHSESEETEDRYDIDRDELLPKTEHDRFVVEWKSSIRTSDYRRLVLPPECKLLEMKQKDRNDFGSTSEETSWKRAFSHFFNVFQALLKIFSIETTHSFFLWVMGIFRYRMRKGRGLPVEDEEEDDGDEDGSVASIGSPLKSSFCTQRLGNNFKSLVTDDVANGSTEDGLDLSFGKDTTKKKDVPSAEIISSLDIRYLSDSQHHDEEEDGGKLCLRHHYHSESIDTNDDATFASASGIEHSDCMESSSFTSMVPHHITRPLHHEFGVLSAEESFPKNYLTVSPIPMRYFQKQQTEGTIKKKNAVDAYRKAALAPPPLPMGKSVLAPNSSTKAKPPDQNPDDESNMAFFDTANSNSQLRDISRAVPIPDANGFIIGDEFVNSSCTPLLVFVNTRSGPQQGNLLITQLRGLLNPIQVWDLSKGGPDKILKSFSVFSRLQILVCGGDGTVSWIISALEKLNLKRWPPIAILPLGTGNDLARVHGWGAGYNNESLLYILRLISEAYVSVLDLWELNITDKKGKRKEVKSFLNYLGVGVDAQAALQVHMLRESKPGLFFSRFFNKAWYAIAGGEEAIKSSCANLTQQITLEADGEIIPLPLDSQGIIFLNIDSYLGGVPLWSQGLKPRRKRARRHSEGDLITMPIHRNDSVEDFTEYNGDNELSSEERIAKLTACSSPSSCQDGMLDVVSIRGSFHLGQIRVGLSNAQLLCQCHEAVVTLKKKVAVQIDGEPWRQNPSSLRIARKKNRATMLNRSADDSGGVESEVAKLFNWASERHIINGDQYALLMEEFSRRIENKKRRQREKSNGFPFIMNQ